MREPYGLISKCMMMLMSLYIELNMHMFVEISQQAFWREREKKIDLLRYNDRRFDKQAMHRSAHAIFTTRNALVLMSFMLLGSPGVYM